MLRSDIYTGVHYVNRWTYVRDPSGSGKRSLVERDREQWIAVKVPPIISTELFEKAQERLALSARRYRQPRVEHLLSGLIRCGECDHAYCTTRWREKVRRASGMRVFHCAAYKCTTVFSMGQHDPTQTKRCRNSKVSTHIVEGKVLEMIQDVMFDADKFARCMDNRHAVEDRRAARKLTQISASMNHLDDQRRCLIERYVMRELPSQEYIEASRALDTRQESLTRAKTEVMERMRVQGLREDVAASVRRFCAAARAQFAGCTDFVSNRQFLRDHIEAVIFDHGRITVVGSVNDLKLPFRIEGQIDRASIHLNSSQKANEAQRRARLKMIPLQDRPISRRDQFAVGVR
jgi:site-specific DNA recombinase